MINLTLSWVEHEKKFITLGPGNLFEPAHVILVHNTLWSNESSGDRKHALIHIFAWPIAGCYTEYPCRWRLNFRLLDLLVTSTFAGTSGYCAYMVRSIISYAGRFPFHNKRIMNIHVHKSITRHITRNSISFIFWNN